MKVDPGKLPVPDLLREIADHIDSLRSILLQNWITALTTDPHAEEMVAKLRDQRMQTDLRTWAAYIEGLS